MTESKKGNEGLLVLKTGRVTIFLLVIGFVLSVLFGNYLLNFYPEIAGGIRSGLLLFLLWLFVMATVRSLNRLDQDISGSWLILSGLIVGGLGALGAFLLIQMYTWIKAIDLDQPFPFGNVLFFGLLGLVVSLISTINLRVQNRMLGNILEVLVFGAIGTALFFWMSKGA